MKAAKECYPCLGRLVRQVAELSTKDTTLRIKSIEEGLKFLDHEFSTTKTSISVATPLHRLIRVITGNTDPYFQMKEAEVAMARELCRKWKPSSEKDIKGYLIFAVRGNAIDFFKDLNTVKGDMEKSVEFTIDHSERLVSKLKKSKNILHLADNAGEVFFDLPLVRRLQDFAPVTYVVKESPVQDDITLADLETFGLSKYLPRVITTGTNTPGVDMALASDEFKAEFEATDLIVAKGMGYWETLSELPAQGKVFYLLKAKCQPVADSLGVALGSYVALLR